MYEMGCYLGVLQKEVRMSLKDWLLLDFSDYQWRVKQKACLNKCLFKLSLIKFINRWGAGNAEWNHSSLSQQPPAWKRGLVVYFTHRSWLSTAWARWEVKNGQKVLLDLAAHWEIGLFLRQHPILSSHCWKIWLLFVPGRVADTSLLAQCSQWDSLPQPQSKPCTKGCSCREEEQQSQTGAEFWRDPDEISSLTLWTGFCSLRAWCAAHLPGPPALLQQTGEEHPVRLPSLVWIYASGALLAVCFLPLLHKKWVAFVGLSIVLWILIQRVYFCYSKSACILCKEKNGT